MSWLFPDDGIDRFITMASGAAPVDGGPITIVFMIKPIGNNGGIIQGIRTGSPVYSQLWVNGPPIQYFGEGDFTGGTNIDLNNWQVVAYSKANGSAALRWHLATNLAGVPSWVHNTGGTIGDGTGPIDSITLGLSHFRMAGFMAAGAVFGTALADLAVEALGTTSMATWMAATPLAAWQFNQDPTIDVQDLTGGGANQTAHAATRPTLSADNPPNWTYFSGASPLTLPDDPGAVRTFGPRETATIGLTRPDAPGAIRVFGPRETGTASLPSSLSLPDRPGAVRVFGPRETATNRQTKSDPLAMPAALAALTCLQAELAFTVAGAPKHSRITPGTEVVPALTATIDECCEGIASVRVERIFPSERFPEPDLRTRTEGAPISWAVVLELMVVRCSVQPGFGMAPTDAALTNEAQVQMDDMAAMRRVACCLELAGVVFDYVVGDGAPVQAEGGCMGGTLQLTVQVDCAEC